MWCVCVKLPFWEHRKLETNQNLKIDSLFILPSTLFLKNLKISEMELLYFCVVIYFLFETSNSSFLKLNCTQIVQIQTQTSLKT